jgi:hypothetical protein
MRVAEPARYLRYADGRDLDAAPAGTAGDVSIGGYQAVAARAFRRRQSSAQSTGPDRRVPTQGQPFTVHPGGGAEIVFRTLGTGEDVTVVPLFSSTDLVAD